MSGKLSNYDNVPLPQDYSEGVDENEWVGIDLFQKQRLLHGNEARMLFSWSVLFPTAKRNITSQLFSSLKFRCI